MFRTGKKLQNTCKNSTRKDFVWISPELQAFWESTGVKNLGFKDHAALYARFKPFGKPEKVPLWRKPKPIPWNKLKGDMPVGTFVLRPENADTFCSDLAHEFEQRAHAMSSDPRVSHYTRAREDAPLPAPLFWSRNPRACLNRADKETSSRNSMAPMPLIKDGLNN